MKLIVKNNAGETVSIQIKSNETFMDLKERVEEEAGISLDLKDIALKGKKITETQKVIEYFLSYGEIKEGPQTNVFCAVPGCKNTKQDNPDKVFFEFPTEEIRCHQWVLYCQRLNAGSGKKRLNLTSESTICSDHFRPDQFVKNTNTLLKRTAVPCVKMAPQHPTQSVIRRPKRSDSPNLDDFDPKNFFSEDSQDHRDVLPLRLRLCRLCANPFDDFIMIFGEQGKEMKIAEKINLCLPIEVQMTDALPKQICRGCFNHLNELFELADVSSLSQEKLIFSAEFGSSAEDLGLLSLDDPGEDEIVGETSTSIDKEKPDEDSGCCPLCKEGKLELLPKIKTEDPSSAVDSLDDIESLNLGKTNSIDQNEYSFENVYSEPFMKKKSSHIIYDPSDLVSQDDSSTGDFTRETDPLRIDENSKSDNDPIGDFNLTSPLNIMGSEDSSHRNVKNNRLSPIAEELGMDSFPSFDTESENSSTLPLLGDDSDQMLTAYCRICGSEFHSQKDLLKHSFSHSFKGFYQCAECKTTFTQPQDLENHFKTHENEEGNKHHCEVCGKSFKLFISLASHKCSQEEGNTHCCYICKKQFKSEMKLRNHMKYHEISRPAYCNLCRKIFPDEIKLKKHNMYIHNHKKAHVCEDCGKVFKSEASMRYHQRAHQSDDCSKPYTCERCGKSFIRKTMLINHMTSSHKHVDFETPCFTCKLCFEAFPSTDAAVAHMDNHHKLECMDESTYSFEMHTINRLFICEFCDRCYAEGSVLNQHREQHPADAPYGCKVCDTTFSTLEEVTRHRAEHVTEEFPDEYLTAFTIPRTYLCEFCERYFLNQVKYNEHLTVHYGPEPYQCRSCSFKFATLAEAQEHRALHGDSAPQNEDYNYYRPYECHYCSKTFAIEDALVKHIRMHTGEKPFICDQCGKGFSQSSGLYTHQKVHSSERPYSCTVCPRTFKIKGDRDVHVRKHSGDRPYKCEFCGKAFMTQHVYSQHRKIHTGERPYKCDVCGIAFRRSHVLTVHKRIHTGEKPNECDICGKRYRQKGDMLKHRRVQHGIIGSKPVTPLVGHLAVC